MNNTIHRLKILFLKIVDYVRPNQSNKEKKNTHCSEAKDVPAHALTPPVSKAIYRCPYRYNIAVVVTLKGKITMFSDPKVFYTFSSKLLRILLLTRENHKRNIMSPFQKFQKITRF